ncbi:MAG TPA: GDP-mannose 4,6-dehydratase [Gemmataceae bacterium]|nr:GDP-mannose 4,6-dehydratase [Gemmataceae bacterium]
MRILVTGVTGFAGGHLAEALLGRGHEVVGLCRRPEWPAAWAHLAGRVALHGGDLCDGARTEAVLRELRPEAVCHLAGYAHVGRSFREPEAAWAGNLTATLALYEAVRRGVGSPRILFVGSGLIYGEPDRPDAALTENCPLRPESPYAASKAAADLASYQYGRGFGLCIIRARPFNHIGPRQSPEFAVAHFAGQLAAVERGERPPVLETGNLSPRRDLTDVRDVAEAYALLLEKGRPGEAYNVGTGQAWSMREVLDRLLRLTGLRVEVRQAGGLVRATETAAIRADATRLRQETGWSPRYSLDQTLADTLDYWRHAP